MQTKITLYNNWESRFKSLHEQLPKQLPKLIQRLSKILKTVPTEFHDEVMCEISTDYEHSTVDIDIYYMREETAKEQKKREKESKAYIAQNEARQRADYERLKAKFEP